VYRTATKAPEAERTPSLGLVGRQAAPGADADVRRAGPAAQSSHVLVVANRTAATPTLLDEVARRATAGTCRFTLLIPDATATKAADWTLESARLLLERFTGGRDEGLIGGRDPFESILQAVQDHRFDEILVSTLPRRTSRWLGRDLLRRVQRLGLPVTVDTAAKQRLRDYQGPAGA
jgi:hypothetical protein